MKKNPVIFIEDENITLDEQEEQDGFEYNGYHFVPIGDIDRKSIFQEIVRETVSNNSLGMSVYNGSRLPYSHDEFYLAAKQSKADVFRCIENGKHYIPGTNELFEYTGEFSEKEISSDRALSEENENYNHGYMKREGKEMVDFLDDGILEKIESANEKMGEEKDYHIAGDLNTYMLNRDQAYKAMDMGIRIGVVPVNGDYYGSHKGEKWYVPITKQEVLDRQYRQLSGGKWIGRDTKFVIIDPRYASYGLEPSELISKIDKEQKSLKQISDDRYEHERHKPKKSRAR